ncbi:pulmonary surfactant-associated protein D-like isoform X1 [Mytilus californianus]|uniref:pulmonary surfactant-associated protein D-like isoform X1 n=2 Tax=Mytilus californianus TaxID=6549 RepID=UPI002246FE22|nr:pulmonary surfactant-associated protein D-like isoform X1 [Mytilus californianus]
MGEQVELVNILQTEPFQSGDNFKDDVWNIKLSEIHKASRKRDNLILAFIVVQLFCISLAVVVNFVYLNDNIERSVRLEKQIHQWTIDTSKLTSLDKQGQLSYGSDMEELFKGDKGARGKAGADGNQGNAGEKGEKGERGDNGLIGPIGRQGVKGEKGNNGFVGSKGQIGDKGTIGEKGSTGIKGRNGEKGIKGKNGPMGDRGVTGEKGSMGDKGVTGENGPNGDKGTVGEKGPTGKKGPIGEKGEKGTIGDKGPDGAKGLDAEKGVAGVKGTEGQKGSKGEMGSSGIIGPTGNKGVNGTKGVTGVKGQMGETGVPGLKGEHGEKGINGDMGTTGQKGAGGEKGEKGSVREPAKKVACGSGWGRFMGSCYNFQLNSKKTWNEAKIDCQRKGGFLVKIEDAVENWFLKSFVSGGSVWIGAHDSTRESRFIWVSDNTPVTFSDWSPNQPDNWRNGEDCVHFQSGSNKWNDARCLHKMGYICEKH